LPINKCWLDLEQRRNSRLKRKHSGGVRGIGIVGLDRNGFDLRAGAATNIKGRSNLAFLPGSNLLVLRLRSRTTTRSVDRFKMDRRVADIFILEMGNCLLVAERRLQIDRGQLPLQFGARSLGQRS